MGPDDGGLIISEGGVGLVGNGAIGGQN